MTPTIEEVKRVAGECDAEMFGSPGRHVSVIVSGHIIFTIDELQAFAQHWHEEGRKEQREIDMDICDNLKSNYYCVDVREALEAIRNNIGE